jgi:hypothetical protein
MAENSYVFYYYADVQGQRKVELRLVNVSTGNVTRSWTVSTTGTSFTNPTTFEVRGAAYDATYGTLYTLVKYTETSGTIHYRLAETLNFLSVDTNQIVLDSSNYVDMNTGAYSGTIFCNLTIPPYTTTKLLCGTANGIVYELVNSNGSVLKQYFSYNFPNNTNMAGTVAAVAIEVLYGIYNDLDGFSSQYSDIIHTYKTPQYSTLTNTGINSQITSVAYNFLDNYIYYYNTNTQLSTINTTPLSPGSSFSVGETLNAQENKTYLNPILFFGPIACIHSSSKVLLSDGSYKLITNVTSGDQVYSPDCKTAIVKEVVPCWLKVPNNPFHKCVVFEKDSLAPNVPSELFIIDPGHPMSFATNYDNHGLRSAKEYVNGKTIYMSDYNDVKEMFPEDMKHNRYDLVLNRGDTYVANNVIVKSRTSFKTAGYDLEVD